MTGRAETFTASEQRLAAIACGAAMATLVPVLLFQTGVIDRLPDPPGSIFDSGTITRSRAAHPFGLPDAAAGLAVYAAAFTSITLARRSEADLRRARIGLGLLGTLAGFNVVRQVVQFRRLCSWCTGTAVATAVMVGAGKRLLARGRH